MQSYSPSSERAGDPFYVSSAGQQQSTLQASNSDELQLTAQLSRGLVPNMTGHGGGGAMSESQEQKYQSQGGANHAYEHHQERNQHYQAYHEHSSPGPGDSFAQYGSPDDGTAPRKRHKVSRACDECRRKKIRCDATGETENDTCTSCRRIGTTCRFSRVPMKRGPSKGYIKELADRLSQLEGHMVPEDLPRTQYSPHQRNSPLQRRGSEDMSSPPSHDLAKKRSYSSVLGTDFGPALYPNPRSGWQQETPRHNIHSTPPGYPSATLPSGALAKQDYSPDKIGPVAQWKIAPQPPRRLSASLESTLPSHDHSETRSGSDDSILARYHEIIHPTFPLLPQSQATLNSKLTTCHVTLQMAFHEALYAAIASFPGAGHLSHQHLARNAAQLLYRAQLEDTQQGSSYKQFVYLQISLLLAIEAGNRAPGGFKGQSVWLGSAVGLAYELKLHEYKSSRTDDPDTDERLGRRIWWALVLLDRWHASSMSTPLLIPDSSVVLMPEDRSILGESLYHLTRLSIVLGHCTMITTAPADIPSLGGGPAYGILGTLLRGELERWREGLPDNVLSSAKAPLVHLCYWYVRILVELTQADSEPSSLLTPAIRIVGELTQNPNLITPLTYHSTVLAAFALVKSSEYESTRTESLKALKEIRAGPLAASAWDSTIRTMISNNMKSTSAVTLTSSAESQLAVQGLQHLAELATTRDEMEASSKSGEKFAVKPGTSQNQQQLDLSEIVKSGYMRILCGESGR